MSERIDDIVMYKMYTHAFKKRIPIMATIEITNECNFRCIHCYLNNQLRRVFLDKDEIYGMINQFVENGTIYLTITGGDPLLHPDFCAIYEYAIKRGLIVTVFTNASLLTLDMLKLFVKYPPRRVEVTFYGMSEEKYHNVTRTYMYEQVIKNVQSMKNKKINILAKMFIIVKNYSEINKFLDYCKKQQLPCKLDYVLVSDDKNVTERHKITNAEARKVDEEYFKQADVDENWGKFIENETKNELLHCGAGRISFWVKANNKIRICNFISDVELSLEQYTFHDIWQHFGYYLERLNENSKDLCNMCRYQKQCFICPAKMKIYTGEFRPTSVGDIPFCKQSIENKGEIYD